MRILILLGKAIFILLLIYFMFSLRVSSFIYGREQFSFCKRVSEGLNYVALRIWETYFKPNKVS
jgi:hypothetical protein